MLCIAFRFLRPCIRVILLYKRGIAVVIVAAKPVSSGRISFRDLPVQLVVALHDMCQIAGTGYHSGNSILWLAIGIYTSIPWTL